MSLEVDLLLDRRRLKRRLVFWRTFSVLALLAAVLVALNGAGWVGRTHLARLSVTGLISEDRKLTEAIEKMADDKQVAGLIVFVDSPGGSVAGGESLHDAIARVAAKKPVVTVMGGVAASAGYMIALPAERIFARDATLTGSIGVLMQTGEVSGLLGKLGIATDAIVSGAMKDQPSFTHPTAPAAREVLRGLVMDMYDQFVGMVAARRHMDPDRVREIADGRAYTGRQALKLGLVDSIGGEADARAWLETTHGLATDMPIDDVSTSGLTARTLSSLLGPMFDGVWKTLISQSVRLDGAWSIWQRSGQ